jgi:hypothetical protein
MCASSTQQNITDGGADMYSTTRQELEFGLWPSRSDRLYPHTWRCPVRIAEQCALTQFHKSTPF